MKSYRFTGHYSFFVDVSVEANNEEEAWDAAYKSVDDTAFPHDPDDIQLDLQTYYEDEE
jgi:hypothetical protein